MMIMMMTIIVIIVVIIISDCGAGDVRGGYDGVNNGSHVSKFSNFMRFC